MLSCLEFLCVFCLCVGDSFSVFTASIYRGRDAAGQSWPEWAWALITWALAWRRHFFGPCTPRLCPDRPHEFVLGEGLQGLCPAKSWLTFNASYFNDHGLLQLSHRDRPSPFSSSYLLGRKVTFAFNACYEWVSTPSVPDDGALTATSHRCEVNLSLGNVGGF